MSRIRSSDTKMELLLRRKLWHQGLRYRKNVTSLPGKPDIAFIRRKFVIFLDSCFWHSCPKHFRMPQSNIEYWNRKITRNKKRDAYINKEYKKMGWKIIRLWEHDVTVKKLDSVYIRIKNILDNC